MEQLNEIEIPDTLVFVITARLDRLDDATKHIIQTAAVIGREFRLQILSDVVEIPVELEPALIELSNAVDDLSFIHRVYEGLERALNFANRIHESQETYQEMLSLAESSRDTAMQISALNKLQGCMLC